MKGTGVLTVISGFSGAGKGTVMKELVQNYPYFLSISATTRKPRTGEVDGREYFFHTREEFEQMIEKQELIEWAEYVGNYYGTPKRAVEQQLAEGKDVILEIEMKEEIQKRLDHAEEEASYMKHYDYIVVNDVLDDAVKQIHTIISNEHSKVPYLKEWIASITEDLACMKEGKE